MHEEHHDHSAATHSAKCDACEYVAKVHAHDEHMAAHDLSQNLADHNKAVHNQETDPAAIHDAVHAKMQTLKI